LRKARETERESIERKQKLDARGKKKQEKAGLPTISMNTFRNNAEKSTARIKDAHAEKTEALTNALQQLRKDLPRLDKMKLDLNDAALHIGKVLFSAEAINFAYNNQSLWQNPLSFSVTSGERVVIRGANGSGKTTLIRIIRGELQPQQGYITRADARSIYIDQDYSLIHNELTVYQQAQHFNTAGLQEHEVKIRLNRFLFTKEYWDSPCDTLSGGEKMRLMLCCLTINQNTPDMILLDEPTNNLDLQNIGILTSAIREYAGTLIVVSHDTQFLDQVGISREIMLPG
jgi:ATPase subunit of ABC transporter with duplicated ATPase domains